VAKYAGVRGIGRGVARFTYKNVVPASKSKTAEQQF